MESQVVRKEVQLRRKELGGELLIPEVRNQRRLWLSSELSGAAPLRGLTHEEEMKYLVPYLGLQQNDPVLGTKLLNFWKDISVEVDVGGVVFDISTVNGEPVNVLDWIKWKFACKHSKVKKTKAEMDKDPNAWFYIYDPDEATKEETKLIEAKTKATMVYAQLVSESDKKTIRHILTNLGVDVRSLPEDTLKITLFSEVEKDPNRFLKLAGDKDLAWKARILDMVRVNILRKVGNSYLYIDETLGTTLEATVQWFKDSATNGEQIATIGARYKDAIKDSTLELAEAE